MLKPLHKVTGRKLDLHLADRVTVIDSFFNSSWKSVDGRKASFITNFLPEEHEVEIDGKKMTLPPLDTFVITEQNSEEK